ncbi:uncharacterized protein LOC119068065 [Bradysia coprophila]|uniref:uncharacterized protein LOC119068065 n=1 Tax=Bradysia coprophila TaxID=38358 RepID=UPI00187DC42F|nr:uncharacterized protein LOC119068065 [Bradysia coprophila]
MMEHPNSTSPQNHQNKSGKRKKASAKKAKKKTKLKTERDDQKSNVWTELDEIERLCLPNYKFVPTTHSEIKPNYPEHYDVDKYLALQTAAERRQYRNSNDIRKNIHSKSDESEWADPSEHRLCHKQLRGQRCDNPICSFKHGFRLPRKLRLCSEWRKGACADGNGCLYLHSEFPCRYHYLGMTSRKHDVKACRYYHGGPLPKEYEDMFLATIDVEKLPMFRVMYSKRLDQLRGQLSEAATVDDRTIVEGKGDLISSHEPTKLHKQEIDRSSLTAGDSSVEKIVVDVADKKLNGSDESQQTDLVGGNVCTQNDQDSSDDESKLHIVDD